MIWVSGWRCLSAQFVVFVSRSAQEKSDWLTLQVEISACCFDFEDMIVIYSPFLPSLKLNHRWLELCVLYSQSTVFMSVSPTWHEWGNQDRSVIFIQQDIQGFSNLSGGLSTHCGSRHIERIFIFWALKEVKVFFLLYSSSLLCSRFSFCSSSFYFLSWW